LIPNGTTLGSIDENDRTRTKADHEAALARIEKLWGAAPGSEDADTLEVLEILIRPAR